MNGNENCEIFNPRFLNHRLNINEFIYFTFKFVNIIITKWNTCDYFILIIYLNYFTAPTFSGASHAMRSLQMRIYMLLSYFLYLSVLSAENWEIKYFEISQKRVGLFISDVAQHKASLPKLLYVFSCREGLRGIYAEIWNVWWKCLDSEVMQHKNELSPKL